MASAVRKRREGKRCCARLVFSFQFSLGPQSRRQEMVPPTFLVGLPTAVSVFWELLQKHTEVGLLGDSRCCQIGNQNEPLPYKHILMVLMNEILSETSTWNTLCTDFVHPLYISTTLNTDTCMCTRTRTHTSHHILEPFLAPSNPSFASKSAFLLSFFFLFHTLCSLVSNLIFMIEQY